MWRYHPTRHEFEVFAYGTSNPWGVDFNDHGHAFITACVIPHLWHMVQGGRYHRQGGQHFNPHVYDDIKTIADHAHYVGNIRDHAWWGHEPQAPQGTLAAGGGHAHCGAMIYLADNWPARYRNQIFMNNIHGNRVNNDRLERAGSGYVGRHSPDLLLANDQWFRGINLKYGPDGSVYLIDWYDRNACHRRTPEIWDRTNGRVYNIRYGAVAREAVDESKLSDGELVALQTHANEWRVRMARRLLQERAAAGRLDAKTPGQLWDLAANHPDVTRKLRALWTLHAVGGLDNTRLRSLLKDPSEHLRAWAIQLEMEDRAADDETLADFERLAREDPSPLVRLYLASALQRLPVERRWKIAEALIAHAEDAADHNLPLMIWYGVEPMVAADPARALQLSHKAGLPLLRSYILRRAASDNDSLNLVVEELTRAKTPEEEQLILDEMTGAFEGRVNIPLPRAWSAAYEKLQNSKSAEVRQRADRVAVMLGDRRIFPRMREVLADNRANLQQRQLALDILVRGRDAEAAGALQAAVKAPALRAAAIRALASLSDPQTPAAVLAEYARLSESQRRDAVNTLVSRPSYALELLAAMESGAVPRTDLHAFNVRQLLRFKNQDLNKRIKDVWGEFREASGDKRQEIARYKAALTAARLKSGDVANGRRLFAKTCAACHRLFGEGGKVGPELTGSNRANLDYVLENILDPSAVLGKDYRLTVLATDDGRVVSGIVQRETDSALTVRTINDTVVVPKQSIEARQLSDKSMMPDGLLQPLKPDEVRDLIAYLGSPTQVALEGPRAPIDGKSGRVPGAIEGESLKVLAKSAGSAGGQQMGVFRKDRWSAANHLWWTGAKPGARLELAVPVAKAGQYTVELVLTRARDYGIVKLSLDGQALGGPIDLFHAPDVVTTGVLNFSARELTAGVHKLSVEILGANPKAVKSYMFGLDYVRLQPVE